MYTERLHWVSLKRHLDPFRDLICCAVTPQPLRASAGGLGSRPIIGCSQAGGECPGHQRTCLGLETRVKTDPSCWLVAPHFHMWAFPETVWVCSQPGGWLLAHEQWGLRTRSLAPHGHECVLAATRQCPHPPAIRGAHITPLLSAGHTSPPCYPRGTHHPAAIRGAHITPLLSAGHTSPCCYPRGTHHPAAIHGAHITFRREKYQKASGASGGKKLLLLWCLPVQLSLVFASLSQLYPYW